MRSTLTPACILERLRGEGMRITSSRINIVEVLAAAECPLTLPEIQERASARGEAPNYATVFRLVSLLETMGIVRKVNLQRPCSYFELCDAASHFDHLVCNSCGQVVRISLPDISSDFEKEVARRYGFTHLTHSLEFFGECPACSGTHS